jgi:glucose-6-phosphate 1-dehydrogenase
MLPDVQLRGTANQHTIWQEGHTPEPCNIVIFGATGDLAQRKLLPTLAHLMIDHPFKGEFCIVAYARRPMNDEQWRTMALESLSKYMEGEQLSEEAQQEFAKHLFYCQGNLDDENDYHKLSDTLLRLDKEQGTRGNRIFYLSTPPELDIQIVELLGKSGLAQPEWQQGPDAQGYTRLITEKPFGHDLASAQQLNSEIGKYFREDQIFRIDHYMGKETVQNILAFRFSNTIFEPLWNRNYIDNVQILVSEQLGIGTRSEYYESAGAIRDMVQNHIMQVLCLTCMETPDAFDANDIRDEKVKLLRAIKPLTPEQVEQCVVRGQYTAGVVNGKRVQGYHEEQGVNANSTTETFVALKLFIENWRWAGVPFYIRTGKCLPQRCTEVTIQSKRVPHQLYNPEDTKGLTPNRLKIYIQPDEGISLRFGAKIPGAAEHLASVNMNFSYKSSFGIQSPDAYERLIADCMLGDSTLFIRRDEIETSWRIIDSITSVWEKMPASTVYPYPAGTWGPEEANKLVQQDGREWDNE